MSGMVMTRLTTTIEYIFSDDNQLVLADGFAPDYVAGAAEMNPNDGKCRKGTPVNPFRPERSSPGTPNKNVRNTYKKRHGLRPN